MKVQKIQELKMAKMGYNLKELCDVFEVNTSTYYTQMNKKTTNEMKNKMIEVIKKIAIEIKYSYGKRRMRQKLNLMGFDIGIYQTATLMKKENIIMIKLRKKHCYFTIKI